ncbi:MAG: adenosylhomocysteinase [Proteobacteria bacterium]|nr:adenosylhomocysteinase [Pseudomonadota bacterium]
MQQEAKAVLSCTGDHDYKVADISLAQLGALDVALAEHDMPALMALRAHYAPLQPLAGAKIVGCLHMTVQTAVLMETLIALGAQLRWSSCNVFSTQDHAAAYMASKGVAVYAWKGQTSEEGEWCIHQTLHNPLVHNNKEELWDANLLLDDGGDLTEIVHKDYPQLLDKLHGVSEETTTGVVRLVKLLQNDQLRIPAIDVNASVSKSKNDNKYGCRHSLNDAVKRGTDRLLAGMKALVIGYGDVGKGSAQSLRGEGMIVKVSEVDPICAMQACMDGFEVVSPFKEGVNDGTSECLQKDMLASIDLLVTATGNYHVCNGPMLAALKSGACVCNIGHFDNEIDTQYLRKQYQWQEIKPQVHRLQRSDDPKDFLLLLSEGRLVNLGNATGHPSRVMDGSFANQVLAQIHLYKQAWADHKTTKPRIDVLPKSLDEQVARYMVSGFGGQITRLTSKQAEYIGVSESGPFKSESYRY